MSDSANGTKPTTALGLALATRDDARAALKGATEHYASAVRNIVSARKLLGDAIDALPRKRTAFIEANNAVHKLLDADVSGVCGGLPKVDAEAVDARA